MPLRPRNHLAGRASKGCPSRSSVAPRPSSRWSPLGPTLTPATTVDRAVAAAVRIQACGCGETSAAARHGRAAAEEFPGCAAMSPRRGLGGRVADCVLGDAHRRVRRPGVPRRRPRLRQRPAQLAHV